MRGDSHLLCNLSLYIRKIYDASLETSEVAETSEVSILGVLSNDHITSDTRLLTASQCMMVLQFNWSHITQGGHDVCIPKHQ
jgi:hypothetical protein